MTITNKQQSKIEQSLKELIPDIKHLEIFPVKKVDLKLDNPLYLELMDILSKKIEQYNFSKFIRISYKQVERLLEEILNTGKFTQIKLNKSYKSIICNTVLEKFHYIKYKDDIIYFKI